MKALFVCLFCLVGLIPVSLAQTSTPGTSTTTAAAGNLRDYVGTYTFESGSPLSTYTITVKADELYGDAGMGTYKLLKQESADQYKSTSSYGSVITFTRDATTKQVTGLSLAAQGQQLSATKNK